MDKAIIYLRVSTDDQTEESQLIPCELFCKKHGYDVINIFREHAKSAYKNIKRPEYDKIIKLVKQRKINHIVVWSIDRWTRRGPSELKNIFSYLSAYDVKFHSVKEQWIETINLPGSMGELIRDFFFGLMAWMAESESKRISDRVKQSEKFQKAKKKGIVGRNELPVSIVKEVEKKLDEGKSYRTIRDEVSYKIKHGKVKHVSIGKISEIANSRSKNAIGRCNKKKCNESV